MEAELIAAYVGPIAPILGLERSKSESNSMACSKKGISVVLFSLPLSKENNLWYYTYIGELEADGEDAEDKYCGD